MWPKKHSLKKAWFGLVGIISHLKLKIYILDQYIVLILSDLIIPSATAHSQGRTTEWEKPNNICGVFAFLEKVDLENHISCRITQWIYIHAKHNASASWKPKLKRSKAITLLIKIRVISERDYQLIYLADKQQECRLLHEANI